VRGLEQIPWFYDVLMALAEKAGLDRWRRGLLRDARGRILDIGCGTGRNLPLYEGPAMVVGVDPCSQSLRAARRRAPGVFLVRARAEALPFRSGVFGTVVSGLVFCSVADPRRSLAEVRRVLGPGGRLRMLEHVRARGRFAARLQDLVQPAWTWISGGCHPNRDTEATVEASGFVIESEGRRARRNLRRFEAVPLDKGGGTGSE
jgi:ubiquinone/menaquinone biosynthesis C-methylase UbiE